MIKFLKPKSILDYGCGKGAIIEELKNRYPDIEIYGYDPAIPGRDIIPVTKVDMIINTDVLEHIPEDELPETIGIISSISKNVYFNLHHAEACQILPNGENAHCTIKPPHWYHELFKKYFDRVVPLEGIEPWLSVVVTFNIDDKTEKEYYRIVNKKKNIRKIYLIVKPVYDIIRPIVHPIVKIIKELYIK